MVKLYQWSNIGAIGYRAERVSSRSHDVIGRRRFWWTRIDDLHKALLSVMRARSFEIAAMVVLPEQLHALWTLPPEDDDYPGRIRLFKLRRLGF